MTEPYLFEKAIGQQMGDLCRLAVGEGKVTQTGEIVTLEDMPGRGVFGVSVEVPYTSSGVQSVSVTRCGKNVMNVYSFSATGLSSPSATPALSNNYGTTINSTSPQTVVLDVTQIPNSSYDAGNYRNGYIVIGFFAPWGKAARLLFQGYFNTKSNPLSATSRKAYVNGNASISDITLSLNGIASSSFSLKNIGDAPSRRYLEIRCGGCSFEFSQPMLTVGSTATAYEPYNGDTYPITLPADFYGGSVNLEAGTVTSQYAADGTELAEPVVSEIDPISIPILAGVNNVWADVGTVTVSYYAADAETFRPALWYPTIYRGLTSARYLIKRASGEIASFDDAIAAPLVGLRVALPWRSEGYDAVEVRSIGYDRATKWGGIQYDVDSGAAASKYPVGAEIEDTWGEYTAPWTVVNHYANGNMVLQWKYVIPAGVQFDAPEALFYADANGLEAGTKHIAIGTNYGAWSTSKNIQFTLTRPMAEGDQFVIDLATSQNTDPTANRTWYVYHAGGTEVLETGTTSDGTGGALLGTIGADSAQKPNGQFNAITRAVFGYARWSQSAIRQYYNSAAPAGSWWTPQNGWDRPPIQAASVDGFLRSCQEDFLSSLEPVEVVTALPPVEGHTADRETTMDKIFLPSLQEMYINAQISVAEGEDWDFYKTLAEEAGLTGKFALFNSYDVLKKYAIQAQTTPYNIWLRSCPQTDPSLVWSISATGGIRTYNANYSNRSAPACIIQKNGGAAKESITLPTTIYGGYLDVVTGQLVATHDENGNLLTNQKLYFLPPVNINALAGVNNVWSDAGNVAVSYRIDNG